MEDWVLEKIRRAKREHWRFLDLGKAGLQRPAGPQTAVGDAAPVKDLKPGSRRPMSENVQVVLEVPLGAPDGNNHPMEFYCWLPIQEADQITVARGDWTLQLHFSTDDLVRDQEYAECVDRSSIRASHTAKCFR